MLNHRLTTALAVIAGLAGVATFTATAGASVDVDDDGVTITSAEEDFTDGNVAFEYDNGLMTPRITGTLVMRQADDTCAHVRIDHYSGATLIDTEYGNDMCVTDDLEHQWAVERNGVADARIDTVTVSIEKGTLAGWTSVGSMTVSMNLFADQVLIDRVGLDVGGTGFAGGAPTSPAIVSWTSVDGQITPHLSGRLHFKGLAAVCGRVKLRYLDEAGTQLDSDVRAVHCAPDNGHYSYLVDMNAVTLGTVTSVEVVEQTQNALGWGNVGSATVSIAQ